MEIIKTIDLWTEQHDKAISTITGEEIELIGSGRTDSRCA